MIASLQVCGRGLVRHCHWWIRASAGVVLLSALSLSVLTSASSGASNSGEIVTLNLKCPSHIPFYLTSNSAVSPARNGNSSSNFIEEADDCHKMTRWSDVVAASGMGAGFENYTLIQPSLFPGIIPPYIHFSPMFGPHMYADPDHGALAAELAWVGTNAPRLGNHIVRRMGMKWAFATKENIRRLPWVGFFTTIINRPVWAPSHVVQRERPWQKYNILPAAEQLCHKNRMWVNAQATMKRAGGSASHEFQALFESYIWPDEAFQFYSRLTRWRTRGRGKQDWWIFKGSRAARSKGIIVFRDLYGLFNRRKFKHHDNGIIQRFLRARDTFQIGGYGLQLRVYGLLTSVEPLRLYVYRDWEPLLVNYQANPIWLMPPYDEFTSWMQPGFVQSLREQINDILVKLMVGVQHRLAYAQRRVYSNRYNGYQFWSADVIVDTAGKAWLMELNRYATLKDTFKTSALLRTEMMLEIFNLVGYHFPPSISAKGRRTLQRALQAHANEAVAAANASSDQIPLLFNKNLYAYRNEKDNGHNDSSMTLDRRESYLTRILEEGLTTEDLKELLVAEDELSRARKWERVFPTAGSFKYLKFLAEYTSKSKTRERSFMVQDAWENKYGHRYEHGYAQGASGQHRDRDRTAAIEELKSLSSMKQHRDGLAY